MCNINRENVTSKLTSMIDISDQYTTNFLLHIELNCHRWQHVLTYTKINV